MDNFIPIQEVLARGVRYLPTKPWQSKLYLTTLAVQLIPAFLRGYLTYYTVVVLDWAVGLPIGASFAAYVVGLGPLVWSWLAFWLPGGGWLWHRAIGAREPSPSEGNLIYREIEELGDEARRIASTAVIYVVDHPAAMFALARGRVLIVSRPLVESEFLRAVLAHELGHLRTLDGRLVQALQRLVIWDDPFAPLEDEKGIRGPWALLLWFWRWAFRIAGGRLVLAAMSPLWADEWRRQEVRADEFAVAHGEGLALAEFLEVRELPLATPNQRRWFNLEEYIPVPHRIDALREGAAARAA